MSDPTTTATTTTITSTVVSNLTVSQNFVNQNKDEGECCNYNLEGSDC